MQQNKPSWHDAPEWANYLAQDADGEWYWYDTRPWSHTEKDSDGLGYWYNGSELNQYADQGRVVGDWRDTLEPRPSTTPEITMGEMTSALADMIEYAECNDPGCPETDAIQLDEVWRYEGGPPTATGCLYLQSLMEVHPVKSRQVAALALMNALFFEAMEDLS